MADTDTTKVLELVQLTMNPTVPIMVAGGLVTVWHRLVAVASVHEAEAVKAATPLGTRIDPRLRPDRCRLFRRMAVAVAVAVVVAVVVVVVVGDVKSANSKLIWFFRCKANA
jgi:hypothetical protein